MLSWSGGRVLVSSGGARHSTGSASTELAFLNGNGAERASWSRQSADPVEPLPLRTVRVLGFLFGNWYARAYLLVVAAVAVLVALVLWIGSEKGNRAGV
jgi:hypothetical protein